MKNLEQIRAAHALVFWRPACEELQQAAEPEKQGDKATGPDHRMAGLEVDGAHADFIPEALLRGKDV